MRIAIQILYSKDWEDLAHVIVPNAVQYCVKHNYVWNIQCVKGQYDAFDKIRHMQEIFEMDEADAVFSLDCDTLITNHTIKVEEYLDYFHDAYFTKDYNGLNCGSFIIKKSEWSNSFLKFILSIRTEPKMYCEQDAINMYMETIPNDEHIKILTHPSINSYIYQNYPEIPLQSHEQGQWNVGDFVLHLPGISMGKRIDILNKTKEQIIYE